MLKITLILLKHLVDSKNRRTFADKMKILIVNKSEGTGGAAGAANRLMKALINNCVKAKMLVREK